MRLYYGTYGHHLSGKIYCYWGDDNLRTGQQVVAPVTHAKSGKNYNTMFTIARAQNEKNAQREVSRLNEGGIFIKTIGGRELLSLPGGKNFETKAEWKRESDDRYRKHYHLQPPEARSEKPFTNAAKRKPKKKKRKKKRSRAAKTAKKALSALAKKAGATKDTATEKAKSALLSNRKTAADSFNQTKRVQEIKQRDAFKE